MAAKTSSKKSSPKTGAKKSVKVQDIPTKKNPRGGSTDHPPKGNKKNDY